MSTVDETPQLAAEAAPAAPKANKKANEKVKDAIIVQFIFQAADKSFVPNFKTTNAPGRTEKAVKHIWEALKKSYASANDVNVKDEAVAKGVAKKRKTELEGEDEGAAKKKNKVAKKVTSEPETEENISDDSFSEVYRVDGIESENEAPTLPDYED
ncbi:hypothetical protein BOTCAL_0406g00070 [Botryotinia calthae]|uniref:Uncharacterized protein n=1 Tax=Botryotinia calthae TaxID=38488 RepID=A0A4Y8CQR9_9HELO|nr:hypothetical protein BOTCAL_0406g00070 [Botryotinia calthae]